MLKKILVSVTVIFFFCLSAKAQRGIKVGYIDMDYILENVPEYQRAKQQLDKKIQRWKSEIESKQRNIDRLENKLKNQRPLLTPELIEEKEEEIEILKQELNDFQGKKFGPDGDFILQKQQLIQPVQDQVFNEIQKIGKDREYDYIIDSSDLAMLYVAQQHDLSDRVLQRIDRTARKKEREEDSGTEGDDDRYMSVTESKERKAEEKAREAERTRREEERQAQQEAREAERARQDSIRNAEREAQEDARAAERARKDSVRQAEREAFEEQRRQERAERERKRDSTRQAQQRRRDSINRARQRRRDSLNKAREQERNRDN